MTVYKALTDSGMKKSIAFLSLVRANFTLSGRSRRQNLETLVMQRREVCQIKDTIIEMFSHHLKRPDRVGDYMGKNQITEELYRREHGSRFLNRAFAELLQDGHLKVAPTQMLEIVYARTAKRYISKTQPLTAILTTMGVYARAVKEHKPYHEPKEYDM